jgi:pimeloyl-ACP methyl ester carboxylesterase
MLSKVARLASGPVRYLEAGSGMPMLLLHAFPLGADQWLPQLSRPPIGWRLIAPDLRGLGGSVFPGDPASSTVDGHAADMFELMAHLDIPGAAIAGLSMGGYVALAMLARHPERVTGLVLADTRASADSAEARAARDRMIDVVRRDGPPGVAREMLPRLLGATVQSEQPDLGEVVTMLIESNSPDGVEAAIQAMKSRPDRTALLASISCPTVVICGAEDVVTTPAECETLSSQVPRAQFVLLPGAGHLSNLENPAAFTAAMIPHA